MPVPRATPYTFLTGLVHARSLSHPGEALTGRTPLQQAAGNACAKSNTLNPEIQRKSTSQIDRIRERIAAAPTNTPRLCVTITDMGGFTLKGPTCTFRGRREHPACRWMGLQTGII